jgi:hypothetical protein
MDESIFKTALAAIASEDYNDSDVKAVSNWLVLLNKEEMGIKRQMEREKKEFLKHQGKSDSALKQIRKNINQVKAILKKI